MLGASHEIFTHFTCLYPYSQGLLFITINPMMSLLVHTKWWHTLFVEWVAHCHFCHNYIKQLVTYCMWFARNDYYQAKDPTIDDLSMLRKFFILCRPCTLLGYQGQGCTGVILNGRDIRACHRGSCTGNRANANYERIASWVGAWFRIHNLDTRGMLNVYSYRYETSQWRSIVRFLTYLD